MNCFIGNASKNSFPINNVLFFSKLFKFPCKKPAANKSPAPVKSTMLRFFSAGHSAISPLAKAIAPFSPLVITKCLFKFFVK